MNERGRRGGSDSRDGERGTSNQGKWNKRAVKRRMKKKSIPRRETCWRPAALDEAVERVEIEKSRGERNKHSIRNGF
jgi:hypothetical protein